MFDHYNIGRPTAGPSHVTVTEKRAPTEDSVRLLQEMEKAARDNVLASVRLDGNTLNAVVHHMRDVMQMDDKFIVQFDLNGKKHDIKVTVRTALAADPQQAIAEALVRAISDHIAVNIVSSINSAMPSFRR